MADTTYGLALFAHVIGVIVLFGAITLELTSMWRMRSSQTVQQVREWASINELLEKAFPISVVVILATGIYMMAKEWGRGVGWLTVALVVLIIMGVLGAVINGQRIKTIQVSAEAAEPGPVSGRLWRQIRDPILWTSVQTMAVLALGLVYLMTLKPDWAGSLITMAIALALGLVSATPRWQDQKEAPDTVYSEA